MSANSFVVDLRKSMVITDPNDFPMNMEKSSKEDYPVDMYPILAYTASNVLGTAFGYKSFFEESTKLDIGLLDTQKVQVVFTYQSSTLDNIQWALCEDGIYVAYSTLPTGVDWVRVVDLSADIEDDVRRLWSYTVIANKVYLYQQGADRFWAIVDPAKYAEAASPSLIDGATIAQVWTNWGCGLISYVPSFLNMEGQIGIFRADNRLGFWDSDSSVGWSSAVAIEDFTPSVTTFAGSTKFADVQGSIVKILGSGDGFIIYASRSIVNCQPLSASPEKWEGEAIFSNMGISFDTQVVAAQPDQIHYAITAAGLVSITNGNPEYIATEVMDFLVENSPLYSLFLIEGRYLFLATGVEFPGSTFSSESVLVNDSEGNAFIFPKPTYPDPEADPGGYMAEYIAGRNADIQAALKDYEPIVPVDSIPAQSRLEPCFDVKIFKSTWAETTYSPYTNNNEFFYSDLGPFSYDYVGPTMVEPVVTHNFIEVDSVSPGDFAGAEVVEKLDLGMAAFNLQIDYQNAAAEAANASYTVAVPDDYDTPPAGYEGGVFIRPYAKRQFGEKNFFDAIKLDDLRIKSNECRVRLYLDKLRKLNIKTFIEGNESYNEPMQPKPIGSYSGVSTGRVVYCDSPASPEITAAALGAVALDNPAVVLMLPKGLAYYIEFFAYIEEITHGVLTSYSVDSSAYVGWALWTYPAKCYVVGANTANYIELYKEAQAATLAVAYARNPAPADTPSNNIQFNPVTSPVNREGWITAQVPAFPWVPGNPADPNYGLIVPYTLVDTGETCAYFHDGSPRPSAIPAYVAMGDLGYEAAWETPAANIIAEAGNYETAGYRLDGTITHEVELLEGALEDNILYEMEVSGFGYYPTNGGSFRKTHNRKNGRTCPIPPENYGLLTAPDIELPTIPPLDPPNYRSPPVIWDYPDSIPLPDNYALFNKGSLAAYYPTYNAAVVYDLLLTKWGMYNNNFRLLQELMPVNRVDGSIMPVSDKGMFGGSLNPAGECTVFKDRNPASSITYGKMGFYRHGMNFASGAVAHFGDRATGTLIVESSMDGVLVDPDLSYAVSFEDQRTVFLPFTSRAKWFNIRVEGNFNLVYLELSAESRGRR